MINAILPGTYVDVVAGEREKQLGTVGVVTMPLELDWGDTITVINKGENPFVKLGYKISDVKLKLVNEVMNYADKLILYRLNTSTQATGLLSTNVTAKAIYGGIRGNDIKVTVTASGSNFVVKTFLDIVEVDTQIVATVASFKKNQFIEITGTGTFEVKTIALTGGANGTVTTDAYDKYLIELEKQSYNVIAYTGVDATKTTKIISFVKEQRSRDVMIKAVLSGSAFDYEGVVNNTIGGKTLDYALTAYEACATRAGILAKCGIETSCTFYDVIDWLDVEPRLTQIQAETRTQSGEALFVLKYGKVMSLYDINSLITFTDLKPKDFSKDLIIRTLDKYAMDLQMLLDTKVIGKGNVIRNNADGRSEIKAMITTMTIDDYLKKGYLEGFTASDVVVSDMIDRDSVSVTVAIRVIDTVDKIYITVTAQ